MDAMDIRKTLQELYAERERLDRAISSLEELQRSGTDIPAATGRRRGRKSMDPEERLVVSQRMKKYWESRRKQRSKPDKEGPI